jgi:hypothetical protein
MVKDTKKANQLLAKDRGQRERESLMLYIVNLKTIYEGWGAVFGWNLEDYKAHTEKLRHATERLWPELWQPAIPQQQLPKGTAVEDRAWEVVKEMRGYLRRFWSADNEYSRDWHIHRAREYHHSLTILPEVMKVPEIDETGRRIKQKFLLDIPPDRHNHIGKALFELQKRALKPKTAPRICPNDCENRYFLSSEKGQRYCPDCRRSQAARDRDSKRKSYHVNKQTWPSTANRRKRNG